MRCSKMVFPDDCRKRKELNITHVRKQLEETVLLSYMTMHKIEDGMYRVKTLYLTLTIYMWLIVRELADQAKLLRGMFLHIMLYA